jgi:hypothetical protein
MERLLKTLRGGCLCGAVRYVVEDRFAYAGYCYCSQCRTSSGSAFSAIGGVAESAFRVVVGSENIATFGKAEGSIMHFCRTCGSQLYVAKPVRRMVHVRLGTLLDVPSKEIMGHVFVSSKTNWHQISDRLPQFPEHMPGMEQIRG